MRILLSLLKLLKAPIMNTIIMNQDVHTPTFIKADASNKTNNIKQHPTYLKDCNAASRNCRVSHCSFSDITLHCQNDFASNLYNPTLAVIGLPSSQQFYSLYIRNTIFSNKNRTYFCNFAISHSIFLTKPTGRENWSLIL